MGHHPPGRPPTAFVAVSPGGAQPIPPEDEQRGHGREQRRGQRGPHPGGRARERGGAAQRDRQLHITRAQRGGGEQVRDEIRHGQQRRADHRGGRLPCVQGVEEHPGGPDAGEGVGEPTGMDIDDAQQHTPGDEQAERGSGHASIVLGAARPIQVAIANVDNFGRCEYPPGQFRLRRRAHRAERAADVSSVQR